MKIVLVIRAYPTQRPGGMPHVCQDRAHALAAAGHEVVVLTTGNPAPRKLDDQGVEVLHLDCPPQTYTTAFARACVMSCRRIEPEVIHLDSFDRSERWWTDRPGKARCVAVTLHGFSFGAFLTNWNRYMHLRSDPPVFDPRAMRSEALATARADRVIAISRHELWMLQDVYGITGARLVYNPIAPYFFDDPAPPPEQGDFVAVGNPGTSRNRGFELGSTVAARLRRRLRILKKVPRPQLPEAYRAACALLLPTFWSQGYDLTVAEALACRRPVIASATGSYLRESEVNPYLVLVPRNDPEALAAAMSGPLPEVPAGAADQHRPEAHVERWLAALE